MNFRQATLDDCTLLAELNHQLIRDEGYRNQMTIEELKRCLKDWAASEYVTAVFEDEKKSLPTACFVRSRGRFISDSFCRAPSAAAENWTQGI